ncbi:hypothetical protein IWQ60_006138 [Tieghemiomyces parasiticus]|uniref:Uncharacterized protein n=1 Tax=Tieghemiomyces parasiticus TaxID=78921 RepID=A0A9W8DXL3_9FUNG|nr:hypothetical protein IWQ60_006138 [Tieghemiomyces parasiticus]
MIATDASVPCDQEVNLVKNFSHLDVSIDPNDTPPAVEHSHPIEIVDIRRRRQASPRDQTESLLHGLLHPTIVPGYNPDDPSCEADPQPVRKLPTVTLYDTYGLELYDRILETDDYYLMAAEVDILTHQGDDIVAACQGAAVLIELGAGSLRKTRVLLEAFDRRGVSLTYYALDVDYTALADSLLHIGPFRHVRLAGLWGTYEDALGYLRTFPNSQPKVIMWLGSSVGNSVVEEAAAFFQRLQRELNPGDRFLVAADKPNSPEMVHRAYHDAQGYTEDFILNILTHVNHLTNQRLFNRDDFSYDSWYNSKLQRVETYVRAKHDITLTYRPPGAVASARSPPTAGHDEAYPLSRREHRIFLRAGERIHVEYSTKLSAETIHGLAHGARLNMRQVWTSTQRNYNMFLMDRPAFFFPRYAPLTAAYLNTAEEPWTPAAGPLATVARPVAHHAVPTRAEWEAMWAYWDTAIRRMVPREHLDAQPIPLRLPFVFYLGHIPAFVDLRLARALGVSPVRDAEFTRYFERGIDPDIQNPNQCHTHSPLPTEWPAVESLLDYDEEVRQRIREVLDRYEVPADPSLEVGTAPTGISKSLAIPGLVARSLWMGYEHYAMHTETLLHMVVQLPERVTPNRLTPLAASPAFAPDRANGGIAPARWLDFSASSDGESPRVDYGLDGDADAVDTTRTDLSPAHIFGWDNEKPCRRGVAVRAFQIQDRPVTVGEYYGLLRHELKTRLGADAWSSSSTMALHHQIAMTPELQRLVPKSWKFADLDELTLLPAGDSPAEALATLFRVRTVYTDLPLIQTWTWPVYVSQLQAQAYARFAHPEARLPTEVEMRHVYAEHQKALNAIHAYIRPNQRLGAIGGGDSHATEPSLDYLYTAAPYSANYGVRSWTPTACATEDRGADDADIAGDSLPASLAPWDWAPRARLRTDGWEWTSTLFAPLDPARFCASPLYPEYSADFFGDRHYVVVGASWATHPRLAQRSTYRNWYQAGYGYAFTTFRLCRPATE